MSSDEKIEISGELDSTPLIESSQAAKKSSLMASWSNISMPGNVGTVLQQQVSSDFIQALTFYPKFELNSQFQLAKYSALDLVKTAFKIHFIP